MIKRIIALSFVSAAILVASFVPASPTRAVSAADWQAGRIIDDGVFTNPDEMSVADIQNFLNSQVPACDTNGTRPASEYGRSDLTHAQYAAMKGWPGPPYVCLRDYYEVPKTSPGNYIPANNFSGSIPAGAVSAAQLIYNAAKANNINPKAILVKIATESAGPLTSDTWPVQSQYTYAMGANCPDSGPNGSANCDRNYAGLSIQLSQGAGLLRWYLDSMDQSWWAYKKPFKTNSILWNVVERGCGAGDVYIESKATAALYTYTPYQPNQAALNNMYGLGDYCSAYGNRNFWRVWSDWFGNTRTPAYYATFHNQSAYPTITAGQSAEGYLMYRNSGTQAWKDSVATGGQLGMINLMTTNAPNRASTFGATWGQNRNRPATQFAAVYESDGTTLAANQHVAQPGQIAKFAFSFTTTESTPAGTYREWFQPVNEGMWNWYLDGYAYLDVTVKPAVHQVSYASQSPHVSGKPGDTLPGWFLYKNTGNMPLYDSTSTPNPTKGMLNLATSNSINRSSIFGSSWGPGKNRPGVQFAAVYEADKTTLAANQHVAQPGQYIKYDFNFTIPQNASPGDYTEWFQPVRDGEANWHVGGAAWLKVSVLPVTRQVSFHSQSAYPVGTPGATIPGWFMYKNTGNVPLYDSISTPDKTRGMLNLATANPTNRASTLGVSWGPGKNRPAILFAAVYEADGTTLAANQHVAQPGQIIRYDFNFTIPQNASAGNYTEWFQPVLDGEANWWVGGAVWLRVTIQ